jgi:hypothetical protein
MTLHAARSEVERYVFLGTITTAMEPSQDVEQVFLSWVADDQIPRPHRREVRRLVDKLGKRMGLGPVTIRYFGPEVDGGDFWGIAPEAGVLPAGVAPDDQPMTIALNAGLRGGAVVAVVAHELGHLAQLADAPADIEADANRRAREVLMAA